MFFLFGRLISMILEWLLKYWIVTLIAVVIICFLTLGCAEPSDTVSDEGSMKKTTIDDQKKQYALAAKSETDNSNTDKSQNNSINVDLSGPEQPVNHAATEVKAPKLPDLPEIPKVKVEQVDPQKAAEIAIKVLEVKTAERDKILKAKIDTSIKQVEYNAKQREDSLLAELASVKTTKAEEMAKIVEARGKERERVILAEGKVRQMSIEAEQKKWEIFAYGGVGIGIAVVIFALIGFKLYLAKSPWDKVRKEKA